MHCTICKFTLINFVILLIKSENAVASNNAISERAFVNLAIFENDLTLSIMASVFEFPDVEFSIGVEDFCNAFVFSFGKIAFVIGAVWEYF
jgi:hypothetical protein